MNYKKLGNIQVTLGYFNNSQVVRFYFSKNKKLIMSKCFLKKAIANSWGETTPLVDSRIIKTKKTFCDIEIYFKLPYKNMILNYIYLMFSPIIFVNVEIWGKNE